MLAAGVLCSVGATASADEILLDGIVVTSGKVEESAIDALSGSSAVSRETLDEHLARGDIGREEYVDRRKGLDQAIAMV